MVYFAHSIVLGLVKIGHSANPGKRVRHLAVESGFRANLLLVIPGGRKREREIHKRFAVHAVGNEWFEPEGSLAEYLSKMGVGHILVGTVDRRLVGQMKRRYTMRLKKYRERYQLACGRQR